MGWDSIAFLLIVVLLRKYNPHVFPLFVGVEVRLFFCSVVSDLIVHPIRNVGRQQGLVVTQRLAAPHNVYIIRRQRLAVGDIYVAIEIVNNCLDCPTDKFLRIHYSSFSFIPQLPYLQLQNQQCLYFH